MVMTTKQNGSFPLFDKLLLSNPMDNHVLVILCEFSYLSG